LPTRAAGRERPNRGATRSPRSPIGVLVLDRVREVFEALDERERG
jgi:hypothetical protein